MKYNCASYAFLSENFRKAFRKVIVCNRQLKRSGGGDLVGGGNGVDRTELTIGMCQNQNAKAILYNNNNNNNNTDKNDV
ncbi:hypothetical protein QR98_0096100 [Sarcoptes scabiei]|uniref:Uncharacterized protein n=1 Tax=Sarcoptes scabiei TaxID=52283 RepID=A0A132AJ78_SARSC|nr:hypothetical protein QR98_0096100 [Sarcoptes scabiei]